MSDPQQAAVYKMEREELSGHLRHKMPMRALKLAAQRICSQYGVPQVRVAAKKERGMWASYDWKCLICLHPTGGRNLCTLAHELAHHLVQYRHQRTQDHGPTFMYYFVELLDTMRIVPRAGMLSIARKYKVRIASKLK